jgi:pyruvate kinase
MLESMITNPRPTRAECSDVANAIYDGSDCVMLSGETANGPYFEQAVMVMARTCCEAESSRNYNNLYQSVANSVLARYKMSAGESLASSAVKTAIDIDAQVIIVLSETGNTARNIAKFCPGKSVICLTPDPTVARQTSGILKGVYGYLVDSLEDTNLVVEEACVEAIKAGIAEEGDTMIVVCGNTFGKGANDQIRVEEITSGRYIVRPSLRRPDGLTGSLRLGFSHSTGGSPKSPRTRKSPK